MDFGGEDYDISCTPTRPKMKSCLGGKSTKVFTWQKVENEWVLHIEDQKIEYDFFRILFMAIIMNQPRFFMKKLCEFNPSEIFEQAKNDGIEFCQFHEWISHEIAKCTYDPKNKFVEMETFDQTQTN